MRRAALWISLVLLPACKSPAAITDVLPDPTLPLAEPLELPVDWDTRSPYSFETWLLEALPEGTATPVGKRARVLLWDALGRMNESSVRAALVLSRSNWLPAASLLIDRLEQRVAGPERISDAGDVLAAAGLARWPTPRRYAQRLVPLAVGIDPHPDLEVRVQCASTSLYAGYEEVIPFLLAVLRIGTPAGEADVRDFEVSDTTAWARSEAAQALSLYAGVPVTYRADAPLRDREEEVERLIARLRAVGWAPR